MCFFLFQMKAKLFASFYFFLFNYVIKYLCGISFFREIFLLLQKKRKIELLLLNWLFVHSGMKEVTSIRGVFRNLLALLLLLFFFSLILNEHSETCV